MKLILAVFICIFTLSNIYAKTLSELVAKIASSTPTMEYVFWVVNNEESKNVPFLSKNSKDGFRVWHFTPDKSWQSIHNASAVDGFPEAGKVFESVSVNNAEEIISFTNIVNAPEDEDVGNKAKTLENKEFKIGWYFWINDKDPFLFKALESGKIRIWYFTPEKKWQPVHNAGAVHGFPKAEETLGDISFDASSGVLTIGKALADNEDTKEDDTKEDDTKEDDTKEDDTKEDKPESPQGITLSSSAIKEGGFLDDKYTSNSPPLSWVVDDDVQKKNTIKSYAISLEDLNIKKYHWNMINIPSNITSISNGPITKYKNIDNDFGLSSYLGPFPPSGETHTYEFSIYGFSSSTISGVEDYQYAIYKSSIKVKYTGK